MEIKTTSVLPFWCRNNENKLSKEEFDKFVNNVMVANQSIKVNFVDKFSLQIIQENNPEDVNNECVRYIYLNYGNEKKYFYFTSNELLANKRYLTTFTIDIYSTYTLQFLLDNANSSFIFNRNFNFEQLSLNYKDEKLENIPVMFNNYVKTNSIVETIEYNGKQYYFINNTSKPWIIEKDLLEFNVDKYAVISLTNGYFLILPVFTLNKIFNIPDIIGGKYWINDFQKEYKWGSNKAYVLSTGWQSTDEKYSGDADAIQEIDNYKYDKIGNPNFRLTLYTRKLKDSQWTNVLNKQNGNGVLTSINFSNSMKNYGISTKVANWPGGIETNYFKIITNGATSFQDVDRYGYKWWEYTNNKPSTVANEQLSFLFKSEKLDTSKFEIVGQKELKNSFVNIQNFINKEENINKFIGFFRGPNIFETNLLFNIDDNYDGLMYCLLNGNYQQENKMNINITINEILNNNVSVFNEDRSMPSYLLRMLDFSYIGNMIDLSLISLQSDVNDETQEIKINNNSNLVFSNGFYGVGNYSNDVLPINYNYIHYGNALPYANDEFKQYIGQNKIFTETSYSNLKSEIALQKQQQSFNTTLGVIGSVSSIATSVASKNVGGVIGGSTKLASTIGGSVFANKKLDMQLQNTENSIKAQYQSASNTMGSTIDNAGVQNILWDFSQNSTIQGSFFTYKKVSNETKIMFNNVIYMNGHKLPKFLTLNEFITSQENFNRNFYYLELDPYILNTQRGIVNKYSNDIYELIKTQLINGIRIWNQQEVVYNERKKEK